MLWSDILLILGRVVTIFPLMLIIALYMGRKSVAEFPVFDFLIIIALGSIVGADIADPKINHFHTAVAIIAVGILQRVVSFLLIRVRWFGKLITFEPTIVIQNGKILDKNLRKIRYSIDNILQMLRENDVFDVKDVDLAIVEASGKLSVYKKNRQDISYPVIIEGKIYEDVLLNMNLSTSWLYQQLRKNGIEDTKQVFFASISPKHDLYISFKNTSVSTKPIIH